MRKPEVEDGRPFGLRYSSEEASDYGDGKVGATGEGTDMKAIAISERKLSRRNASAWHPRDLVQDWKRVASIITSRAQISIHRTYEKQEAYPGCSIRRRV